MLENMKKVYTIGEALIDFIPHEIGAPIQDVVSFKKCQEELLPMLQPQLQNLVAAAASLAKSGKTISATF